MTRTVKIIGLYVVAVAAMAGSFILVALNKATWGDVGPLVAGIVLAITGGHLATLGVSTQSSSPSKSSASTSGGSGAAGVGSAGSSG
ncbi:MAG: hypothetical protein ACYCZM_11950 [Acidimicrobiales bacterium]